MSELSTNAIGEVNNFIVPPQEKKRKRKRIEKPDPVFKWKEKVAIT